MKRTVHAVVVAAAAVTAASVGATVAAAETFTATASVKAAGGASATAPVTIVIDRTTPDAEADRIRSAFTSGGLPALRKALTGLKPTGSVRVGQTKTATRITLERTTEKGRLITIVTDEPIVFLGAGVAGAKPKAGYELAVIDIEVDAAGNGTGTIAPAAKVDLKGSAFVVADYASELVRLTEVKKVK
jgi:hypothetical protein